MRFGNTKSKRGWGNLRPSVWRKSRKGGAHGTSQPPLPNEFRIIDHPGCLPYSFSPLIFREIDRKKPHSGAKSPNRMRHSPPVQALASQGMPEKPACNCISRCLPRHRLLTVAKRCLHHLAAAIPGCFVPLPCGSLTYRNDINFLCSSIRAPPCNVNVEREKPM